MIKSSKSYTIHHPQSSTPTPNTPRLQKEDYKTLGEIADIKYRSTTNQKSTSDIDIVFSIPSYSIDTSYCVQYLVDGIDVVKLWSVYKKVLELFPLLLQ